MEKSPERLKVLERIEENERAGLFNDGVENDPPTIELLPNKVDYLNKKLSSKIATMIANRAGTNFFEKLIVKVFIPFKFVYNLNALLLEHLIDLFKFGGACLLLF